MSFSTADHSFMTQALRLAARGLRSTTPNPRVGCVLVKDGLVIGEGWHEKAGGPHAEAAALKKVDAGGTASGATAYVTLEPCSHHGRTPPCADALIAAGITRVVAAMQDPNPLVAGQGFARLRAAGIQVEQGLLESEAHELNMGFVSRMTRGRPWVRIKLAISLDGKTALANGQSQWITSPDARRDVHAWRARSCAMLTGIGTVREDNPRLTVRDVDAPRQPLRVVVDSRLEIPEDAAILEGACLIACATIIQDNNHGPRPPTKDGTREPCLFHAKAERLARRGADLIALPNAQGKVDLPALLTELGRRGINEVMVEAGAKLNASLLREGLVDELLIYQAPMILGDTARGMFALDELSHLGEARHLEIVERRPVGVDFFIRARFK